MSCASNAPLRENPSVVTAKSAIGSVMNVSRPSDTINAVGLNAAIFSAHVDNAEMYASSAVRLANGTLNVEPKPLPVPVSSAWPVKYG